MLACSDKRPPHYGQNFVIWDVTLSTAPILLITSSLGKHPCRMQGELFDSAAAHPMSQLHGLNGNTLLCTQTTAVLINVELNRLTCCELFTPNDVLRINVELPIAQSGFFMLD